MSYHKAVLLKNVFVSFKCIKKSEIDGLYDITLNLGVSVCILFFIMAVLAFYLCHSVEDMMKLHAAPVLNFIRVC